MTEKSGCSRTGWDTAQHLWLLLPLRVGFCRFCGLWALQGWGSHSLCARACPRPFNSKPQALISDVVNQQTHDSVHFLNLSAAAWCGCHGVSDTLSPRCWSPPGCKSHVAGTTKSPCLWVAQWGFVHCGYCAFCFPQNSPGFPWKAVNQGFVRHPGLRADSLFCCAGYKRLFTPSSALLGSRG